MVLNIINVNNIIIFLETGDVKQLEFKDVIPLSRIEKTMLSF